MGTQRELSFWNTPSTLIEGTYGIRTHGPRAAGMVGPHGGPDAVVPQEVPRVARVLRRHDVHRPQHIPRRGTIPRMTVVGWGRRGREWVLSREK